KLREVAAGISLSLPSPSLFFRAGAGGPLLFFCQSSYKTVAAARQKSSAHHFSSKPCTVPPDNRLLRPLLRRKLVLHITCLLKEEVHAWIGGGAELTPKRGCPKVYLY
uniref:Uncharacterized protein n=1 Tax=Triticum urartu TaxID=4572 RepID=A0A8R7PA34_TRIUA